MKRVVSLILFLILLVTLGGCIWAHEGGEGEERERHERYEHERERGEHFEHDRY